MFGAVRRIAAQSVATAPASAPKNWKTVSSLVLPRVPLAFGEHIDLQQSGVAQGVITSGSGQVTLDLPLLLRTDGSTQTFTAS
jgi:hypothetical protein